MKRVLIVDDDVICSTVFRRMLEANGFAVEVAKAGAEVLARLAAEAPDAVILDVFMPAMSGIEVTRRIRALPDYQSLPILMFTAANLPGIREQALAAGANRVFDKANDKPVSVVGCLHDLLRTTTDTHTTLLSKSGNPDAFLDYSPNQEG